MSYGVKISDKGFDVSSSDDDQAVNTKFNSPKVDLKADPRHYGAVKNVVNSSLAADTYVIKTIEHNYDHVPAVLAHFEHPESSNFEEASGILPFPVVSAGIVLYEWIAVADSEKVQLKLKVNTGNTSGEEITMRYYILAEAGL